jgi:hypothetical protein
MTLKFGNITNKNPEKIKPEVLLIAKVLLNIRGIGAAMITEFHFPKKGKVAQELFGNSVPNTKEINEAIQYQGSLGTEDEGYEFMCTCADNLVFENPDHLSYYRLIELNDSCYYEPKLENVIAMKKRLTEPKSKRKRKTIRVENYTGGAYDK